MPRKTKAKQAANSLTFTEEENRPMRTLKDGRKVPMTDKQIAAMQQNSWKEGQSGNPAGCPPGIPETKLQLHQHTPEAIAVLVDLMKNGANEGARVKAAMAFITPFVAPAASVQEVNHTVSGNISVSKFLKSITDDFERDPSLLIDVTPNKPENPKAS